MKRANVRAAFGGGEAELSAAKSGVPVSATHPECLLRISSAWSARLVRIREIERGTCSGDSGVVAVQGVRELAGVRSIVEYK